MSCANCHQQFNASGGSGGANSVYLPPLHLSTPTFGRYGSGPHSRGESALESEALAAVQQLAIAVQNIAVSEILPRTSDLIFVNLTTIEGQPYCLELTNKGWRVASVRQDCMQGDFTRMEMFTKYYNSLYDLMDDISPGYRDFATNWLNGDKFVHRLALLKGDSNLPDDHHHHQDKRRNGSPEESSEMPDEQFGGAKMEKVR